MDMKFTYPNFLLAQHVMRPGGSFDSPRSLSRLLRVVHETVESTRLVASSFEMDTITYVFIRNGLERRSLTRLTNATVAALIAPEAANHNLYGPVADKHRFREALFQRIPRGPMRRVAFILQDGASWPDLCRNPLSDLSLNEIEDAVRSEAISLLDDWEKALLTRATENHPPGASTMIPLDAMANVGGIGLAKQSLIATAKKPQLYPDEDDNDRIAHRALLNVIVDRISRECPTAYLDAVAGGRAGNETP